MEQEKGKGKPKRIVNYTSTAVSITHYQFVKDIKQYALEVLNTNMTSQQVMDIALELTWKHKEEIQKFLPNPDVEAYLALRAKLIAAGMLPDEH